MTEHKIDAVFEGGGVKGIGLAGAVVAAEELGYRFENLAGTSAGAIVAALVAAGYSGPELRRILQELDYNRFKDPGWEDRIPIAGPIFSLLTEKGIYEGDFLEGWMRDKLAAKGVQTFGDLVMEAYQDDPRYRYKLQVIAADVSRGRMLVLPRDIEEYGVLPDKLNVARAVRMSMSIPFFFRPVLLQDHTTGQTSYVVDGGVLSNFPVQLFDDDSENPPWPTIGFKLVDPQEGTPREIRSAISLLTALFATMMEAHDARYIRDHNFVRTVPVPTVGVGTTEFDLSRDKSEALYHAGYDAAQEFFARWDFEAYKVKYRQGEVLSRTERL